MASTFFEAWLFIELSLIGIIGFLRRAFYSERQLEILKFFIVQAFRGMVIILLFLRGIISSSWGLIIFIIILTIKIASIPFHSWFLNLRNNLSWEALYVFITLQKVIPLALMSRFLSNILYSLSLLAWVVRALFSFQTRSLKKLFVYSSLFFIGILISRLFYLNGFWVIFLFLYRLIASPIYRLADLSIQSRTQDLNSTELSNLAKLFFWFFILNVAGLPPFPGFGVKLIFIQIVDFSIIFLLRFVLSSVCLLYMYIRATFMLLPRLNSKFVVQQTNLNIWAWLTLVMFIAVLMLI